MHESSNTTVPTDWIYIWRGIPAERNGSICRMYPSHGNSKPGIPGATSTVTVEFKDGVKINAYRSKLINIGKRKPVVK